jgi:hypothetical protein
VTFRNPWALAGLVLLVPLVILHLRDRGRRMRDVPSLLLWQELASDSSVDERRFRLPVLPLLLLLQAIALVVLVFALADPVGATTSRHEEVVVLDDSFWMQAPGRMRSAKNDIAQVVRAAPRGDQVQIVMAGPAPAVFYRGGASGVNAALRHVRPSSTPANLSTALAVAAGLLTTPRDHVVLIHAPEDSVPAVIASQGELGTFVAGAPISDQGIFDPSARCGIGAAGLCAVTASVRNTSAHAVVDHYIAAAAGRTPLSLSTHIGANSTASITLVAQPGEQVSLRLAGSDALPADDEAWVTVPYDADIPGSSVVTIVGEPSRALAVARAFAAVPGVLLRLRTPASYARRDAQASDLVVLDGWVPPGRLPPSPAVLLVDPPRLPGGHVGGPQSDSTVSGTDAGSALLQGVDLSSVSIDPGSAHRVTLPEWLSPIVWSPSGPLLAAGYDGHQRLAVASFDPAQSNLPQLASLPVLAANLVRWSLGWTPRSAAAGAPFLVDSLPGARKATLVHDGVVVDRAALEGRAVPLSASEPGVYVLNETGPHVTRQATIAVNLSPAAASSSGPIDIRAPHLATGSTSTPSLTPWFIAAALIAILLEWMYWTSRRSALTQ